MADAVRKSFSQARTRLLRRTSNFSERSSNASTSPESENQPQAQRPRAKNQRKTSFPAFSSASRHGQRQTQDASGSIAAAVGTERPEKVEEGASRAVAAEQQAKQRQEEHPPRGDHPPEQQHPHPHPHHPHHRPPALLVQAPSSPDLAAEAKVANGKAAACTSQLEGPEQADPVARKAAAPSSRASSSRRSLTRRSSRGSDIGRNGMLLGAASTRPSTRDSETNERFEDAVQSQPARMVKRKVWVRRPGASATLVPFQEDDLVDDVRDTILTKYANSLGKSFDSPDMTLKVLPRDRPNQVGLERTLGPEEAVWRILDTNFPGGQDVAEALVIDVPQRRTPRMSPRVVHRVNNEYYEDMRPAEDDAGYFPPMPAGQLTPGGRNVCTNAHPHTHQQQHPHSISILETGHVPAVPSPREKRTRPRPHRQHTSSPTIVASAAASQPPQALAYHTPRHKHVRHDSSDRLKTNAHVPPPPPLPAGSPAQEVPAAALTASGHPVGTPPAASHPAAAAVSPHLPPNSATKKKARKSMARRDSPAQHEFGPLHLRRELDGQISVPPINVLIVEDNIINLKVLEMMVGKLKVRWSTAMNGRDAVTKWREGGYHLVLMDIQLPIMSGLDATKEIRRLERVNGIGVFAREDEQDANVHRGMNGVHGERKKKMMMMNGHATGTSLERRASKETVPEDQLARAHFKSPVIIVALTASSLQSDRREALAAGCNDFLTKPVNFTWFSQKVKEWGCMQALIDFDGWRAWKNLSEAAEEKKLRDREAETEEEVKKREKKEEKERKRLEIMKKMGK